MKKSIFLALAIAMASLGAEEVGECCRTLTIQEAWQRTLTYSPALRISYAEMEQRSGERLQSSFYPNPVIGYSVENVFGNKRWHGWERAESRYVFGQPIELGGKRCYRIKAADYQYCASQAAYDADCLMVLNQLLKAFLNSVAAQELLKLAEEQRNVAKEVLNAVTLKVEAGKATLLQQNKAQVAYAQSDIVFSKAKVDLEISRENLSLLWGMACPDFEAVDYPFFSMESPVPLAQCLSDMCSHPEWMSAQFEQLAACQVLNLEKAERVPDLLFTVGYKTQQKFHGFIFGAEIPLPLYHQNQGNIQAARARAIQFEEKGAGVYLRLENKLRLAHKELMVAYRAAEEWRQTVLKLAEQSFEFAKEGYREGKFDYLEMLDAQRTLFDVEQAYIQALLNYHQNYTDIKYLTTQADG